MRTLKGSPIPPAMGLRRASSPAPRRELPLAELRTSLDRRTREEGRTLMSRVSLAVILSAVGLAGCVVRPGYTAVGGTYDTVDDGYAEVYVNSPPPPPVAEYRPYPPNPGYVWVDGYWDWTGYDWYWTNGFWAPPRQGYAYVRPAYTVDRGRYVYHRGYWSGEGRRDYHYANPSGGWRGTPAQAAGGGYRGMPPSSGGYRGAPASSGGGWR